MRMNRTWLLGAVLLAPWAVGAVRGEGLPADAQKLVDDYDKDAAEIQARADRLLRERREELVGRLRALAERYAKAGQIADADAVRAQIELTGGAIKPEADPGALVNYRGQNGKVIYFELTGDKNAGTVWGSNPYTDDSTLAEAAVHAGVLNDGQKGIVKVTILPGAASYTGSTRNGVGTGDWNAWDGSYRVEAAGARPGRADVLPEGVKPEADPGALVNYRGQNGKAFYFEVTGNKGAGTVWGSNPYTDDSALAAAAVHAGMLADGQKGVVKVTVLPGAASYTGSDKNGVSAQNWAAWDGSYRVEAARGKPVKLEGLPEGVKPEADPGALVNYRGQNGKAFYFEVTGNKGAGSVWGTGLYTDDSALAAAVVHAGVLADGQKGIVKVVILPGAASYTGSEKNGVASDNWGAWDGSYRVQAVKQ